MTDVDDFLSNTLKREKLKKDTNTRKEQLLNELNALQDRMPERIEEETLEGKSSVILTHNNGPGALRSLMAIYYSSHFVRLGGLLLCLVSCTFHASKIKSATFS